MRKSQSPQTSTNGQERLEGGRVQEMGVAATRIEDLCRLRALENEGVYIYAMTDM